MANSAECRRRLSPLTAHYALLAIRHSLFAIRSDPSAPQPYKGPVSARRSGRAGLRRLAVALAAGRVGCHLANAQKADRALRDLRIDRLVVAAHGRIGEKAHLLLGGANRQNGVERW